MKKKLLGMLLAGTLMVGAVGSYAWFSDRATVNGDIKLTMGTLDVKIIDA
ncbi:SipW-dependent-type signal peptide-containing protein [Clostridium perfringens]|nr:SipW-dependent-type signal peptide-containing protein [Clostridium perfringens]